MKRRMMRIWHRKTLSGLSVVLMLLVLRLVGVVYAQAPTPTATPEPQPLNREISTADGIMTVAYPAGWAAQVYTLTGVALSNDPALFQTGGPAIPENGQVVVQVVQGVTAPILDADGVAQLSVVLGGVVNQFPNGPRLFSAPETFTLGDYPAMSTRAFLEVGTDADGQPALVEAYAVAIERAEAQSWVLLTALTAAGDRGAFQSTLDALLLEGISFDLAAIPTILRGGDRLESANGMLSVTVPEGWLGQAEGENTLALGTTLAALNARFFDTLPTGSVIFRLNVQPRAYLLADRADLRAVAEDALARFGSADLPSLLTEFEINGWAAVGTAFAADQGSSPIELYYLFVDYADAGEVLVMIGIAPDGEMGAHIETALSVAAAAEVVTEALVPEDDAPGSVD